MKVDIYPYFCCVNIKKLIQEGESETLEFKQKFGDEAIISIGAIATRKGGNILIGVSNNGDINGIPEIGKETLQQWLNKIGQATEPRQIPNIERHEINGKTIVVIEVPECSIKPVSVFGRFYTRIVNSNKQLSAREVTELHQYSMNTSWDTYPAKGAVISDLDMGKVEEYIALAYESGRRNLKGEAIDILRKLDYITKDGKPTWASILLFGKDPNSFLLQARVRVGSFKGSEIIDDNVIEGNLLEQVNETIKAIKKNIHVRYDIKGRITRKEIWDYPLEALREAVLNSICHRDYSDNTNTFIKIHDGFINFWNPGKLGGDLTIKDLLSIHKSQPRNKLIAQYFFDIGQIEQFGSGIQRMVDSCKAAELPAPELAEAQGGFEVVFHKHHRIKGFRIWAGTDLSVNRDMRKILEYCIMPKSRAEIFKKLKVSNQTRNYSSKIVPLLDKGYLSLTIPEIPKSKHQKYLTTEKGKQQVKYIGYPPDLNTE